jgi:hypothetical protein
MMNPVYVTERYRAWGAIFGSVPPLVGEDPTPYERDWQAVDEPSENVAESP